jgi:hypothetical protein
MDKILAIPTRSRSVTPDTCGKAKKDGGPILNPSYGKKSMTVDEAVDLIEKLARGIRVVYGG